ncbi:MAG TPA: glycosyltransferase family 2 protein [Microbacterium sp.]|nr:glycosyltransferase family 2 protein [Microbacterium sp.]
MKHDPTVAEPRTTAALIVVSFASSMLLEANLARLSLPRGVRVFIVDCYSSAQERARVADLCAAQGWQAVLLDTNAGFGGGVNAGAAVALQEQVDVIATLNPDATIDEESLDRLVLAAATDRQSLFSPRIVTGDGKVWFEGADLYLDDGSTASKRRRGERAGRPRREWATGACFAVSAELWQAVGGFDDDFFLYWEDIDLSHRILDGGGRLVLLDGATAVHDEGQTSGRSAADRSKSPTYYYFNIRNRLLYGAKHVDDRTLGAWLQSSRAVSYLILLQGGRKQLLMSLAPWKAYRKGLRDGRRIVAERRRRAL